MCVYNQTLPHKKYLLDNTIYCLSLSKKKLLQMDTTKCCFRQCNGKIVCVELVMLISILLNKPHVVLRSSGIDYCNIFMGENMIWTCVTWRVESINTPFTQLLVSSFLPDSYNYNHIVWAALLKDAVISAIVNLASTHNFYHVIHSIHIMIQQIAPFSCLTSFSVW